MTNKILFKSSTIKDGNLSITKGDPNEAVENRIKFLSKHKLTENQIVTMDLSHSTISKLVSSFDLGKSVKADALISDDPNLTLFMLTGDCIPLALIDPTSNSFSLIHLSWQNLHKGILTEVISTFILAFHSNPTKLVAKFGPSIGPCCYQQKDPQQKKDQKWKPFIKPIDGTYSVDIWGFTEQELFNLGLQKQNIDNPQLCTYHSGKYFSHHKALKEKLPYDYRFATILKLKDK
jgi:polyphenol oxidase